MNNNRFSGFFGQERLIKKLTFGLDIFDRTGHFPFKPWLVSKKGYGKNTVTEILAKQMKRPLLVLNSSTVGSVTDFVSQILIPFVVNSPPIVVCLDECDNLKVPIQSFLLSCVNTSDNNINKVNTPDGQILTIDNNMITWVFLSNGIHKILLALQDRLDRLEFEEYRIPQLSQIINKHATGVSFQDKTLFKLASMSRGSGRECTKLGKYVSLYCEAEKTKVFNAFHFDTFVNKTGLYPLGLLETEISLLKMLRERKMTLTALSSTLQRDPTTVRLGLEPMLLRESLITVEQGGRRLLPRGYKILQEIEGMAAT
jgi:Holliday junction resolvasome RuvABC ATP-dependent DNA helicase subunit